MSIQAINQSSSSTSSVGARDKLALFLKGFNPLSAKELIALISHEKEFNYLYNLSAGVAERYTVKNHTQMVLESFLQEYADQPEVQEILTRSKLSKEEFMLFLALHDIGKGKAVKEVPEACEERKQLELKYTIKAIQSFCWKHEFGYFIPTFKALLLDDSIGEYLKEDAPCFAMAKKTAACARSGAIHSNLPPADFLKLKVLFHRVDAGSYFSLRERIFRVDPSKKIQLGQFYTSGLIHYSAPILAKIKQLDLAILIDQPLQKPFPSELASRLKPSLHDYSIKEVVELRAIAKQLKASHRLSSEQSAHLKAQLIEIEEAHLPFRSYRQIKMNPVENTRADQLKKVINECAISTEVETRLKLLSKLTFIHGSNSSALAMMHLSNHFELQCLGTLLSRGIAPMGGTLSAGSGLWGSNRHSLSVATIQAIPSILQYAQARSSFKPEELDRLRNPLLCNYEDISGYDYAPGIFDYSFQLLSIWRALDPQEFDQAFAPGTFSNQLYLELLEKYRQRFYDKKSRQPLSKTDAQNLLDLERLIEAVSRGKGWPQMDPQSINLSQKHYLASGLADMKKQILNPFSLQASSAWWYRTSARLLQYKQWDPNGFKEHVLAHRARWIDAIEANRFESEKPLKKLLAIIDWKFTEEERSFLRNTFRHGISSDEQIPDSLLPLIESLEELSSIERASNCDLTPSNVEEKLHACLFPAIQLRATANWQGLINATLCEKLNGSEENLKKFKTCYEFGLSALEKSYQNLTSTFDHSQSPVEIPDDQHIRPLITSPFPIIFSSTTMKSKPGDPRYVPSFEHHIDHPIPLGKGGCDILFTDTPESKAKIESLLPDHIKEQITVLFFKDLDVGSIPLTPSYDHIDRSKTSNISPVNE